MKLSDNTVLVTGGGSGIGVALAKAFALRGNTVIVRGRNAQKLEAGHKEDSAIIALLSPATSGEIRMNNTGWTNQASTVERGLLEESGHSDAVYPAGPKVAVQARLDDTPGAPRRSRRRCSTQV
jgi:NAD(P)-dependent dehydrogenase (short-subunit alcohol dehydrogenase family)